MSAPVSELSATLAPPTALAAIVTLPLTVTTLELVPLKSRVPLLTLTGPALVKVLPKPEVLPAPVRFRKAPLWFVIYLHQDLDS